MSAVTVDKASGQSGHASGQSGQQPIGLSTCPLSTVLITIRDPIGSEPKVYRKTVASDDELFDLLDRAAAKYGSPEPADEAMRWHRAKERAKR